MSFDRFYLEKVINQTIDELETLSKETMEKIVYELESPNSRWLKLKIVEKLEKQVELLGNLRDDFNRLMEDL